jgi:Domain of unknown function (DUF1996)
LPAQQLAANFFGFTPTSNVLNNQAGNNGLSGLGQTAIGALSKPKPAVAQYSPFSNAPSAVYRAGRNNVTVFGAPNNPFQNKLSASAGPKSVPSGGTLVSANTPVAAPKSTTTPSTANTPKSSTNTAAAAGASNTLPPSVTANAAPTTPNTEVVPTPPSSIVQVGLMPAVDISKNMVKEIGYDTVRIKTGTNTIADQPRVADGDGQFRIDCPPTHMGNDDPIVFPNQQGAAHHHTFFGNTTTDAKSNVGALAGIGNSTCTGGIANRSAYWIPSMIDTATNAPIKPYYALMYYKTGYVVPKQFITSPPKGLRMIAGNSKSGSSQRTNAWTNPVTYACRADLNQATTASYDYIPSCAKGQFIATQILFPQCWDGVNLDSPDHKSHMAYADNDYPAENNCPTSHPIAIPRVSFNITFQVTANEGTANWRLASDNYAKNGYNAGFSGHGDWANGWDEKVMAGIVKNCLNAGLDCGTHMLGDGTVIY